MEKNVEEKLIVDIAKLQTASRLIEEVYQNLQHLKSEKNIVLPLTLHGANTRIRNVTNVLKIAINPEEPISISIPMYVNNKDFILKRKRK